MASSEGRTGELTFADTQFGTLRLDKKGQLVVVGGGGNYQEAAYRGRVFSGANTQARTSSVGLTATNTNLVLSNPAASTVNLVLLNVGITGTAPTAASIIGLQAGWATAGVVTHTTPAIAHNNLWNSTAGTNGQGLIDEAATTVGTPVIVSILGMFPITGATAQVVTPPIQICNYDLNGSFVITPGGWISIYTSTAVSIWCGMTWAEIPV